MTMAMRNHFFFTSPLEGEVDRRSFSEGGREGGNLHLFIQIFTPLPNPPPHSSPDGERPRAYGGRERSPLASRS